jgi:DNA-binding NtrC family response regulator
MASGQDKFTVLLVDDEQLVLSSLKRAFFEYNYLIHAAGNGREALDILHTRRVDAAIIDLKMPGMDGLELLQNIRRKFPEVMCLMLTGHGGVREAVEAIKLGALDFLEKPYQLEELTNRVVELQQVWLLNGAERNLARDQPFRLLLGESPVMVQLKDEIARVARTDASVLIHGETGTGKELVARALHAHGGRAGKSFVPVDCAALTETLAESELFGHLKGAFTGAQAAGLGLIRTADKGTLFLDEIGELSPAVQAKLLRVLQEKEVRPIGSTRSFAVDARIIAATHRDLAQQARRGGFREDLFYRLNVVTLEVPPLRQRREDIPLLARFFLERYRFPQTPLQAISSEAGELLEQYDWPGNIRELENVIQRAAALSKNKVVEVEDLPSRMRSAAPKAVKSELFHELTTMEEFERAAIVNALRMCANNRKSAAQFLNIGEATLYRKLKKYGIVI